MELLEMVKKYFKGPIPKQYSLVEFKNRQLMELIENELFVISYVVEKWSKEIKKA